jgi:DHA2 family multidrug resistance protein
MSSDSRPVHKWLVTLAVMLATVIEVLDVTIANVSLPHMQATFSASVDEITWVLTSYLVATGIVVPMTGWLARAFGAKRVLIGSTTLFTIASVLCGIAWDLPSMVFFRLLQGAGGAALMPLSQTKLLEAFPPREHGLATAIWGIGIMVAPILGPTLGGWLTDNYHWRWIFLVNVPIGVLAVALQAAFVPGDPKESPAREARTDYLGFLLIILSIGCMQIVLDRGERADWFAAPWVWAFCGISLLSTIVLLRWEWRHESPVVDIRLFRDPGFAAGAAITVLLFASLYSNFIMFGLFLQLPQQYPALQAGFLMAPRGFATMIAMFLVGQLYQRLDARLVLALGVILIAVGSFEMSHWPGNVGPDNLLRPLILTGLGIGLAFVPLSAMTISSIPPASVANASALFNLMRNTGASVGITLSGTLLVRWGQLHQAGLVENVHATSALGQAALTQASFVAQQAGADPVTATSQAYGMIYGLILREASLNAFMDVFRLSGYVVLLILPLILFLRKPAAHTPGSLH